MTSGQSQNPPCFTEILVMTSFLWQEARVTTLYWGTGVGFSMGQGVLRLDVSAGVTSELRGPL